MIFHRPDFHTAQRHVPRHLLAGQEVALPAVDRTVEVLLSLERDRQSDFPALCRAVSSSEPIRCEVLQAVCEQPLLIEQSARRAALLRAVSASSHEPLVRELAMVSLESSYLKNSLPVVSAAARILESALFGTDEGESRERLSESLEMRLLAVAARYTPGGGDLAAGAALLLLKGTTILEREPCLIRSLARSWFSARHQEKNPWLAVLSASPTAANVGFIASIAGGNVPTSEGSVVLRAICSMPFTIHEVGAAIAIATFVTRQICLHLRIPKGVSNATLAGLSTALVIGGKAIFQALQEDSFNAQRDWERVEAIARLSSIRSDLSSSPAASDRRLAARVAGLITRSSRSIMQPPIAREAARIASAGEPLDPVDLWNEAINSGDFDAAKRRRQPDIVA